VSPKDRKADRHIPGRLVPLGVARIDRETFDRLDARHKALGMTRRAAVITAIREWLDRNESTEEQKLWMSARPF
jgi:hypothetical protein